jgi:serine/threonine-protein kinase
VQRFLDGDRDVERRRELSAQHTERARTLAGKPDIESRAEAMREAGSAIALDPGSREAQAVLARLLLEPPKTIPDEARRKIDDERQQALRAILPRGVVVYLLALMFMPIANVLGLAGSGPMLVVASELVAILLVLGVTLWRGWRVSNLLVAMVVTLHIALLATIGFALGPLLVLPMLVFGSLPIFLMMPTARFPKTVIVLHLLAFVVPLAIEALGLVPASYSIEGGALVLEPWAVTLSPQALLFLICALVFLQLVGNTLMIDAQRAAQDRAQELLHVQSWQLAQLVRSSGSQP